MKKKTQRKISSKKFEKVLKVMNSALAADPGAIYTLMNTRMSCNDKLADHKDVQIFTDKSGRTLVGALGLINGVLKPLTGRRIAAAYDNRSGQLVKFVEYVP